MPTLVIAGFHRSGTSMATQILHSAGLFVGDKLLGAIPSNRYGHFEDEEVLAFHERVLMENGSSWMFDGQAENLHLTESDERWMRSFVGRRNTSHELWGFKDPRTCLFLPHWDRVLGNARYLIVFRDFLETSQSILNRQSLDILTKKGDQRKHLQFWRDPALALQMWNAHVRIVVSFATTFPDRVLCVRHRQLLDDYPLVQQLNDRFGLGLNEASPKNLVDLEAVTTEIDSLPGLSGASLEEAISLWKKVESLTGGHDYDLDERIAKIASAPIAKLNGLFPLVEYTKPELWREYDKLFARVSKQEAPLAEQAAVVGQVSKQDAPCQERAKAEKK